MPPSHLLWGIRTPAATLLCYPPFFIATHIPYLLYYTIMMLFTITHVENLPFETPLSMLHCYINDNCHTGNVTLLISFIFIFYKQYNRIYVVSGIDIIM